MPVFNRQVSSAVAEEALALIVARGDVMAYAEARRRARAERNGTLIDPAGPHFWDDVRREIGRLTGHVPGGW
jgi:hypothetical protein